MKEMNDRSFDKCMKRICRGDQEGLKQIYEAYLPYIYSVVFAILQNKEDAEDVSCEFFIRLWNTAEQYRPGSGHKTYLTAIARNMAIDFLRKRKREIASDLSGGEEREENEAFAGRSRDGTSPPEEADTGFEDRLVEEMTLKEALQQLDQTEREIVNLKIMTGYTFKEIAELLSMPMGTVTWKYREALKKLRRYGYE